MEWLKLKRKIVFQEKLDPKSVSPAYKHKYFHLQH